MIGDVRNPGSHGFVAKRPYALALDHHALIKLHAKRTRPHDGQWKVYCYKRADFVGLNETLNSDSSINSRLETSQNIVFSAIDQRMPQTTLQASMD